jgi:hypothetical protein
MGLENADWLGWTLLMADRAMRCSRSNSRAGEQGTVVKTLSYMQSNQLLSRAKQPKNLTTLFVQKAEREV